MQNTMELTQEDIPQNTKGRNGAVDTSLQKQMSSRSVNQMMYNSEIPEDEEEEGENRSFLQA